MIRVNLTFDLDADGPNEREIKDRLDALLVEHFADVKDWNTRWAEAELGESPLFGAAKQQPINAPDR